jgi:hypothetical protein
MVRSSEQKHLAVRNSVLDIKYFYCKPVPSAAGGWVDGGIQLLGFEKALLGSAFIVLLLSHYFILHPGRPDFISFLRLSKLLRLAVMSVPSIHPIVLAGALHPSRKLLRPSGSMTDDRDSSARIVDRKVGDFEFISCPGRSKRHKRG